MVKKISFVFLLLTSNVIEAGRTPKDSPKGKEVTPGRFGNGGGVAKKVAPCSPKRNLFQTSPHSSPNTRLSKLREARSKGQVPVMGCKALERLVRKSLDETEIMLKRDVAKHGDMRALGKGPDTPSPIKRKKVRDALDRLALVDSAPAQGMVPRSLGL